MKNITLVFTLVFGLSTVLGSPVWSGTCGSHTKKSSAGHTGKTSSASHAQSDIVDTAVSAGSFQTLVTAVKAAGLVDTLKGQGPFTVFAPSDAAFAKLPKGTVEGLLQNPEKLAVILSYHVVPGKVLAKDVTNLNSAKTASGQSLVIDSGQTGVKVDSANITKTDIICSNGVIHVIDAVLIPKDIVGVAASAGTFNTLAAALGAGGLVAVLEGDGPFTVFAPTDEAFAKLPPGTVEDLLKPENKEKLVSILTFHVVQGRVSSEEVVKLASAKTLNGQEARIEAVDGNVRVDGANVIAADINASNGVIHVVDQVLIP